MNPPQWTCEDECPSQRGDALCTNVNHFSNWAVLLGGGHGGEECGTAGNWIIGEWEDILLITSMIIAALIVMFLCVMFNVLCHGRVVKIHRRRQGKDLRKLRVTRLKASVESDFDSSLISNESDDVV